jgi:hypothetical protein
MKTEEPALSLSKGLRYTFVEDDEHGPYFLAKVFEVLEGKTLIAYAVKRAGALKITRALNREDLRLFAKRARPLVGETRRFDGLKKNITAAHPKPKRRFRSKRKL